MASLIHAVNQVVRYLFDVLLWPFRTIDPLWPVVFVSLVSGILMVWVFGKVSNQDAIRGVKQKIQGNLLGVRLYQHDAAVVLRLQGRIVRSTLAYMRHSLVPVIVLLVPVLLILVQLNLRFSSRPIRPGEHAVVKALMREPALVRETIVLRNDAGIRVETAPARVRSTGEVAWRIRAEQPGRHRMSIRLGDEEVDKEVVVADGWDTVSVIRTTDWLDQLLYSGEPPIESGRPVRTVEVLYRPLEITIWGWEVHWLVLFFVLSIAFGFAFKGMLGVEL